MQRKNQLSSFAYEKKREREKKNFSAFLAARNSSVENTEDPN